MLGPPPDFDGGQGPREIDGLVPKSYTKPSPLDVAPGGTFPDTVVVTGPQATLRRCQRPRPLGVSGAGIARGSTNACCQSTQ